MRVILTDFPVSRGILADESREFLTDIWARLCDAQQWGLVPGNCIHAGASRSQQETPPDQSRLPTGQWFSVKGDFAPIGTFGNAGDISGSYNGGRERGDYYFLLEDTSQRSC